MIINTVDLYKKSIDRIFIVRHRAQRNVDGMSTLHFHAESQFNTREYRDHVTNP